jgi:hypothetical protein
MVEAMRLPADTKKGRQKSKGRRRSKCGKESETEKQAKEKPRPNLLLLQGTSCSSPGKLKRRARNVAKTARNLKREEEKGRKRASRTRTNKMRARRNQKRKSDQINDTRKDNMHSLRVISPDDG